MGAKWWLLGGLGVGLVMGYLALLRMGPSFDASARILITKKIPKQAGRDEDRNVSAIGDRAEHIHLIMSPKVIGPAVQKHHLDKLKTLKGEEEPDREIIDALRVRRVGGQERSTLNVFELTFNWGNEHDAREILEAVIDSYNDYLVTSRKRHGEHSVDSIRLAADNLWAEVKAKEKEYLAFRQTAPLIWKTAAGANGQAGDTTNVYQERVREYEAERRKNREQITEVKSKISALEDAIQKGEPREKLEILARKMMQLEGGVAAAGLGGDTGQISTLQSTLIPLMLEEAKLVRAGFGQRYYGLMTVRQNIKQVKEFYRRQGVVLPEETIAKGPDGVVEVIAPTDAISVLQLSLRYHLQQLQNRDIELTTVFEDANKDAKKFDHFLTTDQQYNDDIRRMRTLHMEEVNRLDRARMVVDDEGYSMEQIAPVFTEKSKKRMIQCLGMGGALGFAVAFGLSYLLVMSDHRLKSADDMRTQLGLSVLGQVPSFTPASMQSAARARPDLEPTLFYITRPGSHEAEAYRSVRTALFFRCQKAGHKVIQITSPEPQDGKTTVAANLALAMAHAGKKVLLIDADMRCPNVHKIFHLRHEVGLSDVAMGEILFENAVQTCEIAGLHILSAGMTPTNPAELLGNIAFERLVNQLRSEYDYIIIDTPPLMAVSDPSVVASRVDVLLLVVRMGKNKITTIRNGCETLSALGVNIIGTVVNDVPNTESKQYGGAYHETPTMFGQLAPTPTTQVSAPITVSAVTTPAPVASWMGTRK
ncbi:MAG: capsular exopolysaccharide family [Planctomycetaceae bacterium]|nr:capsular exopolysaccharide family [Planctomycetaceae bacterium]